MIPNFNENGLLPPGVHWATWEELCNRFGYTMHRKRLLEGLKIALNSLKKAGCRYIYINGSFITNKMIPNDFDACWDSNGINFQLLKKIDPILLNFADKRAAQKVKYLGELFPIFPMNNPNEGTFLDFFQIDKETGNRKGIVAIDLERLL